MITKTIYIVRHGETEYNRKGIVQGSLVDAPLNEKGQWQAQRFHEQYQGFNPEVVYTSALQRTHQSVQKFLEKVPKSEVSTALNEISWGSLDGKMTNEDSVYLQTLLAWEKGDFTMKAHDGESPQEVMDRQNSFIEQALVQSKEQRILICMHGRAMRILLCGLLNKSLSEMDNFKHSNLCLYEIQYTADGVFEMVRENDISHLI